MSRRMIDRANRQSSFDFTATMKETSSNDMSDLEYKVLHTCSELDKGCFTGACKEFC